MISKNDVLKKLKIRDWKRTYPVQNRPKLEDE